MSKFAQDLKNEQILATYLDKVYQLKGYDIQRQTNTEKQHQGIDLLFRKNGEVHYIDEKAQLHYLNADLPTFTFELSYLNKKGLLKTGWLFDASKVTDTYFLVTGIILQENLTFLSKPEDIATLKITAVSRRKLTDFLAEKDLSRKRLSKYDETMRHKAQYGRNNIKELDGKKEGLIFYTEHLQEKPMNLQLRLDFLIRAKVAKRIWW